MTREDARLLCILVEQLTEDLRSATSRARQINEIFITCAGDGAGQSFQYCAGGNGQKASRAGIPLMDEATLSVVWRGKSLYLGRTRVFGVLTRLSRSPNRYVTHVDLLGEVWGDEDLPSSTLRSLMRDLRRKLRAGGMADLAECIRGHNEHYILVV